MRQNTLRFYWMDEIRGAAIILLIIFHSSAIPAVWFEFQVPEFFIYFNNFVAPLRMPVLMVLSGMLLGKSLKKPIGRYISGKIRLVLWPIIIWSCIYFIATENFEVWFKPWTWIQENYLWYIAFIFAYYMVAPLLVKVPPSLILSVGLVFAFYFDYLERGFIAKFFYFLAYFYFGHLVASKDLIGARNKIYLVISSFFVFSILSIFNFNFNLNVIASWVLGVSSAVFLATVFMSLPVISWLAWVGRNSIVFYLAHYPLVILLFKIFPEVLYLDSSLVVLLVVTVVFVSCSLLAYMRKYSLVNYAFEFPAVYQKLSK